MALRSDDAYVVGTFDLGESDVVVTLVAEHAGTVRGVAPAARKSRKRFGGSLDPLTRVRARWWEKEGRELHRIESLECERSYSKMQADPVRQAACAVLAEISTAVAREGQSDRREFRLLGAVLDALEGGLDPWLAVRYFEFWTLKLHGVLPDLEACSGCGNALSETKRAWVTVAEEGLRCDRCARSTTGGARSLSADERTFLALAAARPPRDLIVDPRVAKPGRALDGWLRGALESFVERRFRTYRHLDAATSAAP